MKESLPKTYENTKVSSDIENFVESNDLEVNTVTAELEGGGELSHIIHPTTRHSRVGQCSDTKYFTFS